MTEENVKNESKATVSRRSVLKGAVALGAVAMTGGFALNLAAPGTAQAALKKMPTKWDETWDVVVVGSGFAGLAAAAEAAGAGAKRLFWKKCRLTAATPSSTAAFMPHGTASSIIARI